MDQNNQESEWGKRKITCPTVPVNISQQKIT